MVDCSSPSVFGAHTERVGWRGLWDVRISCWALWIFNAIKHLWLEIPCWSPVTFLSLPFRLNCDVTAGEALAIKKAQEMRYMWSAANYLGCRRPTFLIHAANYQYHYHYLLIDHLKNIILVYLSDLRRKGYIFSWTSVFFWWLGQLGIHRTIHTFRNLFEERNEGMAEQN